ncbi:MAG TPA: beta-galactosidase, partial [Patescibacteria group bacterium]|nr:beta-galactosidase [Patescibacteria group bacterium]
MLRDFFHRHFVKTDRHTLIIAFFFLVFLLANFFFISSLLLNNLKPPLKSKFGVTFSVKQAEELGLDWKQTYTALLDELNIRYFRIPAYWDRIEFNRDEYNFEELDYIIAEAEARDAKIILAMGQRVPRWPECHPPAWAHELREDVRQSEIIELLTELVERYKHRRGVFLWQVENEPLLSIFGECPKPDIEFLEREVAHVKSLDDTRPVMVTDSGELSLWLRISSVADILGISMYRITWNELFGYFFYPLTPRHYQNKAAFANLFVNRVIITELQGEPWADRPLDQISLAEQFQTMNVEIFKDNIEFAQQTGFEQVYLWGAEWWYWLKQQG